MTALRGTLHAWLGAAFVRTLESRPLAARSDVPRYPHPMTDDDMDRIIAALDAGRSVSFYGADGEWGYRSLGGGRYLRFAHVPYERGEEDVVQADEVRRALGPLDYERVASRLQ